MVSNKDTDTQDSNFASEQDTFTDDTIQDFDLELQSRPCDIHKLVK
jgi:hypothetical protein